MTHLRPVRSTEHSGEAGGEWHVTRFLPPVGRAESVREQFYTVERRLSHPAAVAISEAARRELFKSSPNEPRLHVRQERPAQTPRAIEVG